MLIATKRFTPTGGVTCPIARFTAVSYTHLDVYKRQDKSKEEFDKLNEALFESSANADRKSVV